MKNILSISLSCLLVVLVFSLCGNVISLHATTPTKWTGGTIYIIDDGLSDMPFDPPANHTYFYPPDAPINHTGNTYTLTEDVISGGTAIFINESNMILDGAGHTLQGFGNGTGVILAYLTLMYEVPHLPYNVTIMNLTITHFAVGIDAELPSNDTIAKNTIVENYYGVQLNFGGDPGDPSPNMFYENNFIRNYIAFLSYKSFRNTFFHNNFINNTVQVDCEGYDASVDNWFCAYPVGGNYWSNYNGTDTQSGPYQNETEPDGFGDTPYQDNTPTATEWITDPSAGFSPLALGDNYPLMNPYNYDPSQSPDPPADPIPITPEFPTAMMILLLAATTMFAYKMRTKKRKEKLGGLTVVS